MNVSGIRSQFKWLIRFGCGCLLLLSAAYAANSGTLRRTFRTVKLDAPIQMSVAAAVVRSDESSESEAGMPHAQLSTDLSIEDLIVTQAVYDEPLVLGKETAARVVVGSNSTQSIDADVTVAWEGQTYSATATVQAPGTTVDVLIGAPTKLETTTISATVSPTGLLADTDPSNNDKSVTLPVVETHQKITVFFLPVDWTPDQMQRYNFQAAFPQFVADTTEFMQGVYPVAKNDLVTAYTMTPHMLAPNEKTLATNTGAFDAQSAFRLYASISRAGRRLRPDAFAVIGIFPPGWLAAHGEIDALGFALTGVKGTVSAMFIFDYSKTTAHEVGHLFWLYEDYDQFVSPPRSSTYLDRSGYWVQRRQVQDVNSSDKIPTFMSGGAIKAWVDTRIYEYLMGKFIIGTGGRVSEPLILSATMSSSVQPEGENYPAEYSAAFQRFEPKSRVYVAVSAAGMKGGETLEARWYRGDQELATDSQTLNPGEGWYDFSIANRNGFPEANTYRVEISLDGKLVKSPKFEIKSSSKK